MTSISPDPNLSNAAERAIWLQEVPELAGLLSAMPDRAGKIAIHYCFAMGGLVLVATLSDDTREVPDWWWHESVFLPTERPHRVVTRLTIAYEQVAKLTPKVETPKPNIVRLEDFRTSKPPQS